MDPSNVDDGDHFLPAANTSLREIPKSPPMCLLYGYILAGNQPSDHAAFKIQYLSCSFEDNGEIFGGQENEHGECVFDIYFSQDDNDYLVKLVFGPVLELSDEDSQQEEEELESDHSYDYDEEIFEDEQSDDNLEPVGYRICNLYFPGDFYYVVRLVFENEEEDRFLVKEDEFLFEKLQRAAGISSDGGEEEEEEEDQEEEEEAVPTIDDKSSGDRKLYRRIQVN